MKIYKAHILVVFFFLFFNSIVLAQDIFDEDHSQEFANYLFKAGQYNLAFAEYKRLSVFDSLNTEYQLRQLQCLRMEGLYKQALTQAEYFSKTGTNFEIEKEYARLLILNAKFEYFDSDFSKRNILSEEDLVLYKTIILLLENDFEEAEILLRKYQHLSIPELIILKEIAVECKEIRLKRPLLSGFFSSVLPGSGKVYSAYWQDGTLAFLYTGMSAWQTYRGFKKYGFSSVYGWISAGMTTGFYLGNIYGSVKAANKYNHQVLENYHKKIEEILINY